MKPDKDFYVGYLPMPGRLAKFTRNLVILLALVGLGAGFYVSASQRSPGNGIDDLSELRVIKGYLTVDPYPVLHEVSGNTTSSRLMVEQTKHVLTDRAKAYAGKWVEIAGYPIHRGDWGMLAVPDDQGFKEIDEPEAYEISEHSLGKITLQGEIMDSKCYLGAMKPGGGKAHRACAALCLLGGIPPLLVNESVSGEKYGYLLMNEDRSSASIELARWIGIPVEVTGELVQRGDLQYLSINKASVTPL